MFLLSSHSLPSLFLNLSFLFALSIAVLNLGYNYLNSEVPSWVGTSLKELRALHLGGNMFSGVLSPEFFADNNFNQLGTLLLVTSQSCSCRSTILTYLITVLASFPPDPRRNPTIERLEIQSNPTLQGSISDFLESLPSLVYLDVSFTGIGGTLPSVSSSSASYSTTEDDNLEVLKAASTYIEGSIPTDIGIWGSQLQTLQIGGNGGRSNLLNGTMPTEFGLLTALTTLEILESPSMTGLLPTELASLGNLQRLSVSNTGRQGPLPVEYQFLTNLMEFDVSTNVEITGTVPVEYTSMSKLGKVC